MIKQLLLATLFFSLFTGCSKFKTKKAKVPVKKSYSQETDQAFESIENETREQTLDRYKKIRWKNWNHYKKKKAYRSKKKKWSRAKKRISRKRAPRVIKKRPPLSPEKLREMNIEIDQNLAYFCLKNRKKAAFKDASVCKAHTLRAKKSCLSKYPYGPARSSIRCVKKKLSLR